MGLFADTADAREPHGFHGAVRGQPTTGRPMGDRSAPTRVPRHAFPTPAPPLPPTLDATPTRPPPPTHPLSRRVDLSTPAPASQGGASSRTEEVRSNAGRHQPGQHRNTTHPHALPETRGRSAKSHAVRNARAET